MSWPFATTVLHGPLPGSPSRMTMTRCLALGRSLPAVPMPPARRPRHYLGAGPVEHWRVSDRLDTGACPQVGHVPGALCPSWTSAGRAPARPIPRSPAHRAHASGPPTPALPSEPDRSGTGACQTGWTLARAHRPGMFLAPLVPLGPPPTELWHGQSLAAPSRSDATRFSPGNTEAPPVELPDPPWHL